MIVYIGLGSESPMTMLFGRFVYGLGGESLGLAINTLQILWFKGKELGLSQVTWLFLWEKFIDICDLGLNPPPSKGAI